MTDDSDDELARDMAAMAAKQAAAAKTAVSA